jgi:hypothetical protein
LDTGEIEAYTGGRGLHELVLASRVGKGWDEIVEAAGGVVWGTDGRAHNVQAIVAKKAATVDFCSPSVVLLNIYI